MPSKGEGAVELGRAHGNRRLGASSASAADCGAAAMKPTAPWPTRKLNVGQRQCVADAQCQWNAITLIGDRVSQTVACSRRIIFTDRGPYYFTDPFFVP